MVSGAVLWWLGPEGAVSVPKVTTDPTGNVGDSPESARLAVPPPLLKSIVTVYGLEVTPALTLIFAGVTAMLLKTVSENLYCAVSPEVAPVAVITNFTPPSLS
jgi:hypothetical protein